MGLSDVVDKITELMHRRRTMDADTIVRVYEAPDGFHWMRMVGNISLSHDTSWGFADVNEAIASAVQSNPNVPVEVWIQNRPLGAPE